MLTKALPLCAGKPEHEEIEVHAESSVSCECCSTRNVTEPQSEDERHEEKQ